MFFLLLKNPSIENTNADQPPVFVAFRMGVFNDVRVTGIYRGALLLLGYFPFGRVQSKKVSHFMLV